MPDIKQLNADFDAIATGLSFETREKVKALLSQIDALRSDMAPTDLASRALSKQIGQTKKRGEDASALLEEKKTLSAVLDRFSEQIASIEKQIQDFFAAAETAEQASVELEAFVRYRWSEPLPFTVCDWTPDVIAAWDHYVNNHPHASIYHLTCWKTVIEEAFGHPAIYLFARDATQQVCGVLPMIRLTSGIFGDFIVSVPYFNYGGPLGEHAAVEAALLARASEVAQQLGVKHVEWRDDIAREGLPLREDKVAMLRDLPDTTDALWQQIGTKLRAQIKRPQKENVTAHIGGEELLDDFYAVFATNMRDLGTPVYAKHFFAVILRHLGARARIVVLKLNGKPVSTAFLLGYRQMLEIPWASTIREVNHLSMNMLLYWEVLSFAIREGYRSFDFGRSTRDAGTYKFKEQWGAQPKQLYWHYWLPAGQALPKLNPDNPKFQLAIAVWQRLPLWLTKIIGPPVVKFLP